MLSIYEAYERSTKFTLFAAFNKTMDHLHKYGKSLKDFNYNNKEIADEIYAAMNSTKFLGISVRKGVSCCNFFVFLFLFLQGEVAFSSEGDRIALTQIEQVINGKYVVLGYYNTQADNLTWFDREVWRSKRYERLTEVIYEIICVVSRWKSASR